MTARPRIYTRTGDGGQTGLANGRRVAKTDPRIRLLGELDELNALLGLVRAQSDDTTVEPLLADLQARLFDLGGALAGSGLDAIDDQAVNDLEQAIDRLDAGLAPLRTFILPGPPAAAASAHLARAVCRRAERSLWALHQQQPLPKAWGAWLNRLADLLFVLARHLGRSHPETPWRPSS